MYYELILNEENTIRLTWAQYKTNELFQTDVDRFKRLDPAVDYDAIIKVKTRITLLHGLRKLLKSFENISSVRTEQFSFHQWQLSYCALDDGIDKLFNSFNKRSSKNENEINNNSYRVTAMWNAHNLHKESFPPLNAHLKIKADSEIDTKKHPFKV